jgi:hypothetical protein
LNLKAVNGTWQVQPHLLQILSGPGILICRNIMNQQSDLGCRAGISYEPFRFFNGAAAPSGTGPPHYRGFTITLRHTTLGRTPLDERSVRCRGLYLTTHNTHKRQTSIPPVGFESTIPATARPRTYALDRVPTGIGDAI